MEKQQIKRQTRTVSMAASILAWEDIDIRVKNSIFKDPSNYIQYLVERDILHDKKWRNKFLTTYLFISNLMIMILVLMVLLIT